MTAPQNVHVMRDEVRAEYEAALQHLDGDELFHARLARFFTELRDPLVAIYGEDPRFPAQWRALLDAIARTAATRDPDLRRLDHEREITPDWLQREQAVGYVTYADRFAGTLVGVRERLPYLRGLGVSYLHLMPLLKPRPEPNDGGYAVADYGAVDPTLGSLADLRALAKDMRAQGMALCIDVVLNHTAREHAWAQAALAGDADKLAYYRTFADRAEPDAYERTLPEVFPDTAPGNFTWVPELGRWVWTTFNDYQWDLDYTNPAVFRELAEVMLALAATGVDVLRLDAVPFLWKRLGTNSQNQPEVHQLLQSGLPRADDRRARARVDAVGLGDLDVDEPGRGERLLELGAGERAGDAAGPLLHVGACRVVHVLVGDHVGHGEAPARLEHARGLAQDLLLVAGEVDDAVGDDDVDGGVGQRDLLEVALEELGVLDAGRGGVGAREREHLVGHVEPDRAAARARRAGR